MMVRPRQSRAGTTGAAAEKNGATAGPASSRQFETNGLPSDLGTGRQKEFIGAASRANTTVQPTKAVSKNALSKAAAALDVSLYDIVEEAQAAAGRGRSPFSSSVGVVKRRVYELVRDAITKRKPLLKLLGELGDRPTRSSALSDNQFHWVLNALQRRGLSGAPSERRRIANELQYARRHDVPVEYVVGFLLQTSAGNDIYRRVSDPRCREPEIPLTPRRRLQSVADGT